MQSIEVFQNSTGVCMAQKRVKIRAQEVVV